MRRSGCEGGEGGALRVSEVGERLAERLAGGAEEGGEDRYSQHEARRAEGEVREGGPCGDVGLDGPSGGGDAVQRGVKGDRGPEAPGAHVQTYGDDAKDETAQDVSVKHREEQRGDEHRQDRRPPVSSAARVDDAAEDDLLHDRRDDDRQDDASERDGRAVR